MTPVPFGRTLTVRSRAHAVSRIAARIASGSASRKARGTSSRIVHPVFRLFLLIVLGLALAEITSAQTKRALLIGINNYNSSAKLLPLPAGKKPAGAPCLEPGNAKVQNLCGPVNDVMALAEVLEKFYAFDSKNVLILTDAAATRQGILTALRRHLRDAAAPGDLSVFVFAGHGSQRFNSLSDKPGHWDQTIVPQDVLQGAEAIRDKELGREFKAILSKGVLLSTIFDSCYSGAITRGMPRGGRMRFAPVDTRDARDPGDPGKTAEQLGALRLSAAQPNEEAAESDGPYRDPDDDAPAHGFFSLALAKALRSLPPNTPAGEVLRVTSALMDAQAEAQHPAIAGPPDRPLFGGAAPAGPLTLTVKEKFSDGTVVLDGGRALGFGPGTTFRKKNAAAIRLQLSNTDEVATSLARVIQGDPAAVQLGDPFEIEHWEVPASERLRVWMPPPLPDAALSAMAEELAKVRAAPELNWVADPLKASPNTLIEWDGAQWFLRLLPTSQDPASPCYAARIENLGPAPSASMILQHLAAAHDAGAGHRDCGAKPALFVSLPPSQSLAKDLREGIGPEAGNGAVGFASRAEAQYLLSGRLNDVGSGAGYAWILPNTVQDPALRDAASDVKGDLLCSPNIPLPLRTDWFAPAHDDAGSSPAAGAGAGASPAASSEEPATAGASLVAPSVAHSVNGSGAGTEEVAGHLLELAARLARIVFLQQLAPPRPVQGAASSGEASDFPYYFALKPYPSAGENGGTTAPANLVQGGAVREGQHFTYTLVADPRKLNSPVQQRWVYVFLLDCAGRSQLLFPLLRDGNTFNLLPAKDPQDGSIPRSWPAEIPLASSRQTTLCINKPFGRDTYFLLSSTDKIEDLSVFQFAPVLTRGGRRGGNSLERLLGSVGAPDRGEQGGSRGGQSRGGQSDDQPASDTHWALQRLYLESLPHPATPCPKR